MTMERSTLDLAVATLNYTGAAQNGDLGSFKYYNEAEIYIILGETAGGTPAVIVEQAQDASGTGVKAAPIEKYFTQLGLTGTGYTEVSVVNNTFNLPAEANRLIVIPLKAEDLDTNNGFTYFRVAVASPGVNDNFITILYRFSKPRYAGKVPLPDPKV